MCTLQDAIENIDIDGVATIIRERPQLINERCVVGILPIHYAAKIGALPIVELLAQRKDNNDAIAGRRWTALHSAASCGHPLVVEALIRLGNYTIDALDEAGVTPLRRAVERKHVSVIEKLVQLGSKALEIFDRWNNAPVHITILGDNASLLETLLRLNPATINISAFDSYTPLDLAIQLDQKACMKILVALGGKHNTFCQVPILLSEEEILDIRHRIYFATSLVSRLLFFQ